MSVLSHFPMQKREKRLSNISSTPTLPIKLSSAKHTRRKSSAKISNGNIRPVIASANASKAISTACNCRSFAKTNDPDKVIFSLAKSCKRSISSSILSPLLTESGNTPSSDGAAPIGDIPACRGRPSSQSAIRGDKAIPRAVRHLQNHSGTSHSTKSADRDFASARLIPSCSIGSMLARIPARIDQIDWEPAEIDPTSMISRVVPAYSETMAASRLASLFSRLDFPAFGGPAISTVKPSRISSARSWLDRKALSSPSISERLLCTSPTNVPGPVVFVREIKSVSTIAISSRMRRRRPSIRFCKDPDAANCGKTALLLRFGGDEVPQRFDADQIDLAIGESAACKFARQSESRFWKLRRECEGQPAPRRGNRGSAIPRNLRR